PAKIATLEAVRELAIRLWAQPPLRVPVHEPAASRRLFAPLAWEEQEVVAGAFLTCRNRLISSRIIFKGGRDSSLAQPGEILREALRAGASKLIVAHNHPSGIVEPSEEDLHFTVRLEWGAQTVGIRLIDHLILVPGGEYFSF